MVSWIRRRWMAWRLSPGLKAAAEEAYQRAWSHRNANMLGPEMNLINLSNDLNGYRLQHWRKSVR